MAGEDWASAFRPEQIPVLPQQVTEQAPVLPQQAQLDSVLPQQSPEVLSDTILSSIAEMFMLLEQRTRESLVSIIESQEQQGLLIARKFEELERMILDGGELPITNIDALDPALADEIRLSLDEEEVADEPDFMPELAEPEVILPEIPLTAAQEEMLSGLDGSDHFDGTYDTIRTRFEQENYAKAQGLTMEEAFGGPIDEEPEESSLLHVAEDEVIVPRDIKTAYWEWKDGNGTFQQFVKAAGGPKGAKKYRELIEN